MNSNRSATVKPDVIILEAGSLFSEIKDVLGILLTIDNGRRAKGSGANRLRLGRIGFD